MPKLGTSDHFTVLIKPKTIPPNQTPPVNIISKRDLRPSRVLDFGRWITQYDWSDVLSLTHVQEKYDLFNSILTEAVHYYLPLQRTKCCSSDKPWITHKLKFLITKSQKALVVYGKDSQHYKELRNKVQRACIECKQKFYDSKVASLKESNISRWWREVKGLTDQRAQADWVIQLPDEDTPAALAEKLHSFLSTLTSHFNPLNTTPADLDHNLDVPREFLVDVSSCYKALRQVKSNKSPGPSAVPNKIWKEFASELAPVVTDIYNASLGQGFIPYQIKESLVTPLPKCSPPKINVLRTI